MLVRAIALCALCLASAIWTHLAVGRTLETSSRNAVDAIDIELTRAAFFPEVLARDPRLATAITSRDEALVAALNSTFELWAKSANAEHIFLLDSAGTTVTASNWASPNSFVGRNYGFRPYFKEAINNGSSTFFAIGATTGQAGYFLTHAVSDTSGRHIGVVVVKLSLAQLSVQVSERIDDWFVVDDLGASILASEPAWTFRVWRKREGQRQAAESQRRYIIQDPDFSQINLSVRYSFSALSGPQGFWALYVESEIRNENWHLISMVPLGDLLGLFGVRFMLLALVMVTAWFAWSLYRQQRIRASALDSQARAIRAELAQTQAELVQKESWAAIGQMSSAIAHEVNQPLASLRFDLASLGKLSVSADAATKTALNEAKNTTTRIARIIETLRLFARQHELELTSVDVQQCISSATKRFAKDRPQASTFVHLIDQNTDDLVVLANDVLLEQVIINLLSNAVAAANPASPEVTVECSTLNDGMVAIVVRDNGPGTIQHNLSDDVGSSKSVREGFGLGLSLSKRFIESLGGTITASRREHWTEFLILMKRPQ